MYGETSNAQPKLGWSHPGASWKLGTLLRNISDDDSDKDDDSDDTSELTKSSKPWLAEFNGYLHSRNMLGNLSIVQWWGVRLQVHLFSPWSNII